MRLKFWEIFSDNSTGLNHEAGYTLIEMAVVAAIIGLLSTAIITSFSRTRIDLDQSVNLIDSTIRLAQSQTISSVKYNGYTPCGYGIHYVDATHYAIYVGPDASTVACSTLNRNYQSNQDALQMPRSLEDGRVQFMSSFNDIFFEPPDPKTYLDNNATLNQAPIGITIGKVGTTCPQNCKTIYVYPSGKIQ